MKTVNLSPFWVLAVLVQRGYSEIKLPSYNNSFAELPSIVSAYTNYSLLPSVEVPKIPEYTLPNYKLSITGNQNITDLVAVIFSCPDNSINMQYIVFPSVKYGWCMIPQIKNWVKENNCTEGALNLTLFSSKETTHSTYTDIVSVSNGTRDKRAVQLFDRLYKDVQHSEHDCENELEMILWITVASVAGCAMVNLACSIGCFLGVRKYGKSSIRPEFVDLFPSSEITDIEMNNVGARPREKISNEV